MGKIRYNRDCRKLHHLHYGSGHPVFRGELMQEGYGLGGLISGLFRKAIPIFAPLLKEGAKTLGRAALKTGRHVLADVMDDKASFKDSLKKNLKKRITETLSSVNENEDYVANKPKKQTSRAIRRRKGSPKKYVNPKRSKKDIFE